jgi:hypothetical protein
MLMDEDYENLSREEWGSVFLLMLHQWAKGGTLPDDRRKLAWLARCTPDELDDLLAKWPKLEPVDGQPGRTGIPYLVKEWDQVMGFYETQRLKAARGGAARWPKQEESDARGDAHGDARAMPYQDQDQDQDKDQDQDQKRTTCPEAAKPPSGPAVVVLPCVGKGMKEWPVTQSLLDDWKDAFPGLDPLAEAKRMRLWLEQNPKRGKTYAGMGRFTTNWLSRAQDSAKPTTPNQGAQNGSATHRHARRDAALRAQLSDAGVRALPGLQGPDGAGQEEPW